ncbi:SEC-C metal-binding domain-containing protein [Pedobacter panaciterrae]|uniref:SEC-C metal-binding domain-containing protein n=1 Tax=Pedobacter panaciterrae TaxID=363849 RepID=A0ABU8NH12_9SPHI
MTKLNRNDPCYCGSGKKYKKCCIHKEQAEESILPSHAYSPELPNYENFTRKYNTAELLQIFSVMQLQPENHGKNIRLESLVISALNQYNKSEKLDYHTLKADILKFCPRHVHEDPVEDFFTENILFVNGNNTVYPGIFIEAQEILQSQVNAMAAMQSLRLSLRKEIYEGILFMLYIHQEIAFKLGHSRRMAIPDLPDELYLPDAKEMKDQQKLVAFSQQELSRICEHLIVPEQVIDAFVYPFKGKRIGIKNLDDNPLLQKPFVLLEETYILAMPSAQLGALNDFILEKLKSGGQLLDFSGIQAEHSMTEADTRFRSMGWERIKYTFHEPQHSGRAIFSEGLYQCDSDKLVYVFHVTPIPSGKRKYQTDIDALSMLITRQASDRCAELKAQYSRSKLLLLVLYNKADIFEAGRIDTGKFRGMNYQLVLTMKELNVLRVHWEFDTLTLWKYARHIEDTKHQVQFMPSNSHLSRFKWYKDNHEWNFESDRAPMNGLFFEFEIEGNVNRAAKLKEDRIGIPFPAERGTIQVSCHKQEEHMPVYLSDEVKKGYFRHCLLRYSCPIWVQSDTLRDFTASVYMNGVLYWLNHCHSYLQTYLDQLGTEPLVITLMMDKDFKDQQTWDLEGSTEEFKFTSKLVPESRGIELSVPVQLVSHLTNAGNGGEKFLMTGLIDAIGDFIELTGAGRKITAVELDELLSMCMPQGMQKMILISDSTQHPVFSNIDIEKPRSIPLADISYVLSKQVTWLKYNISIPEKIATAKEKTTLLNDLVKVHFDRLIELISRFPTADLLVLLMQRHESMIQSRAMGKLSYPALEACFGHYYDVFVEFSKKEADMVTANLSMRTLIEFVACEKSTGMEPVNDADADLMLAHMSELINYGALSDMIRFGIADPNMGMLASGRIGIDRTFNDASMTSFQQDIHREEYEENKSSFGRYFNEEPRKPKAKRGDDPYYDRVDDIFMEEWGITLWDMLGSAKFLCLELYALEKSVLMITEEDLLKLFADRTAQPEAETLAFLQLLTFVNRAGVMNIDPKDIHETYPWRYNRRISYMLRPLLKIERLGKTYYLISARHLMTAAENILSRFMDGTLKVAVNHLKINNLLAERNHIKGTNFRNFVCKWLVEHTDFEVVGFEVKIKPRGFFPAQVDKGDVDILCLDHKNQVLYAIECKNTSQAKIAYDIYTEISNYIGLKGKPGMIEKHVQRDLWLKENSTVVRQKLGLSDDYRIKSFVLTKHILPTRYIKDTPLPVYAVADLKSDKVFISL